MLREQAAEGPHTPQQAAPQQLTHILRFGNFDQQDVASGFASPPRAAPPVRGHALQMRHFDCSAQPARST